MTDKLTDGRNRPRRRPVWGLLCCFCLLGAGCAADTGFVEFATLARATTPNDALACPAGFCVARTDFLTQAVPVSADALSAKVQDILSREPRTELVARDSTGLRLVYVQRSRLFRFPDTVNIAVIPMGRESGIALYSRSNYGHGDLGVNFARVKEWLAKFGIPIAGGG